MKRNDKISLIVMILIAAVYFSFVRKQLRTTNNSKNIASQNPVTYSYSFAKNDFISSMSIAQLVDILAKREEMVCGAVGIAASEPPQYKCFEQLKKIATNDDLLNLIKSSNPVIRAYAITALTDRNYADILKVFQKHLYDKAEFWTFCGCMKTNDHINSYFLHCIAGDIDPNVYEKYRRIIF